MTRPLRFNRRPQPVTSLVKPQTGRIWPMRAVTSSMRRAQASCALPRTDRRSSSVGLCALSANALIARNAPSQSVSVRGIAVRIRWQRRSEKFVKQSDKHGNDGNGEGKGSPVPQPVEPVPELRRHDVGLPTIDLQFPQVPFRVLELEARVVWRCGVYEIDHEGAGKTDHQ